MLLIFFVLNSIITSFGVLKKFLVYNIGILLQISN